MPVLSIRVALAFATFAAGAAAACSSAPISDQPSAAAGATPSSSIPGRSGPDAASGPTYVEDLKYTSTSDPYDTRETANIDGRSYPHSQGARFCFGDKDRKWEYDLGRRYDRFRATIGLEDDSTTEAVVRYEIIGDGRTLYSQDVQFGMSFPVDVSVQNVLRLQMGTTLLSKEGSCGAATAQWGEVRAETGERGVR